MTPKETQEMTDAIGWFKKQFANDIQTAVKPTPFTPDMVVAIALQETYFIWKRIYRTKPLPEVLELCVGDPNDSPPRDPGAFPSNRAALEQVPNGPEMFRIARDALVALSKVAPEYQKHVANPDKFCRGFGLFQYDLQAFEHTDPDYFLKKKWVLFPSCLSKCIVELMSKKKELYHEKQPLTEIEMAYVAVAYNAGSRRVDLTKDFRHQGHENGDGYYYGENFWDYMQLSKATPPAR